MTEQVVAVVAIGSAITLCCAVAGYGEAALFWAAGTALEAFLARRRT